MRSPALYLHTFSLELRNVLFYTFEFWIKYCASVFVQVLMAYYLWEAIYSASASTVIGGFSLSQMVLYNLIAYQISLAIRGPDFGFLALEIYGGTITKYIVYPLSFFWVKFSHYAVYALLQLLQLTVTLAAVRILFPTFIDSVSVGSLVVGLLLAILGSTLYFSIMACIEQTAFWVDNTWALMIMLMFIANFLGGTVVPLNLFPDSLATISRWLPFKSMIYLPTQAILGHATISEILSGMLELLVWSFVMGSLAHLIWDRGSREYTAVGM